MSVFSREAHLIFVHVPKCAGTSIRKGLARILPDLENFEKYNTPTRRAHEPAYAGHMPLWKIEELNERHPDLGLDLSEFRVIFSVRNPWARMASLYRHRLRKLYRLDKDRKDVPRNTPADILIINRGFGSWLLGTPSRGDSVLTRTPQILWATTREKNVSASLHVLRMEDLDADWAKLTEKLDLPPMTLPRMQARRKNPTPSPRDEREECQALYKAHPGTRAHVAKFFAPDIERFNHVF